MSQDFIRVKDMEGTLLLSHKNGNLGCTVTTKEIIFQRPHCSYHILFKDIISMIPHSLNTKRMTFMTSNNPTEKVKTQFSSNYYKIVADKVRVYRRSGIYENGETDFIVPLHKLFLNYFAKYADLTVVG
jgi:hypothetical protein